MSRTVHGKINQSIMETILRMSTHCTIDALLGKKAQKCSTLNYCFSKDFHLKNREILHKAVLTPQEYKICFLGEKNLLGVFLQVKIGLKRNLSQK